MDIVNKSKALNILIPRLITKSNNLTKEIKNRIKLNKIFSEFENKASNNLNYFITASNQRYTNSKLGNDLDTIISSTRVKDIKEANKIVNDKFYKDTNLEVERQKMKYKSSEKIYKNIKEIFNKMKLPLETKFSKNSQKEIELIIKGKDDSLSYNRNNSNNYYMYSDKKIKRFINSEDNVKGGKYAIKNEFDKEKNSIENAISMYLNNIPDNVSNSFKTSGNSPLSSKKYTFKLPKIKLINYKQRSPQKKRVITEEEKKPNIKKLLPYSRLGRHLLINTENNNSLNEIQQKNFPFITGTKLDNNIEKTDYHDTVNVVYHSANKEFFLRNSLDKKRKRLEEILGINNIPQLNTYDDILFKKFETIKNKRHEKARKINESQQMAILSRKEKVNMIIDNDMELLDKLENKLYSKTKEN